MLLSTRIGWNDLLCHLLHYFKLVASASLAITHFGLEGKGEDDHIWARGALITMQPKAAGFLVKYEFT